MLRRRPRSTLFPTRRSSDLGLAAGPGAAIGEMTGYLTGYGGSALIDNTKLYGRIKGWMEKYGLVVISVLAADRKSTRLNSSHLVISYAVFCLKKKKLLMYHI